MTGRVPKGRITRGAKLGGLAAGQAARGVGMKLSVLGRTQEARQRLGERSTLVAAQQIVTVLGEMKGAAMKLGQMLSALELDLVPEAHRETFRIKLTELCDRAPTVDFAQMRTVIESDIGRLSHVFAEFDETPIAAASIGQVYRARLHDGRWVAVKVKYPGVDDAVAADMANLSRVGGVVSPKGEWKQLTRDVSRLHVIVLVSGASRRRANEVDNRNRRRQSVLTGGRQGRRSRHRRLLGWARESPTRTLTHCRDHRKHQRHSPFRSRRHDRHVLPP